MFFFTNGYVDTYCYCYTLYVNTWYLGISEPDGTHNYKAAVEFDDS